MEEPLFHCDLHVERIRELKTHCERQVIYAITDLPEQAASADRLLELSRAHWDIENRSFRVKDGTFAGRLSRPLRQRPDRPGPPARLHARPDPPPQRQTKTRPRSFRC